MGFLLSPTLREAIIHSFRGACGHRVLTDASCERADKVESEDPPETKDSRLYRGYSDFMNRLPKRTDIFKGIGIENYKKYKTSGKNLSSSIKN
jgi:hypothetical protein